MSELILPRRSFLLGLGAMLAAPAIVKAENLMKCTGLIVPPKQQILRYEVQIEIGDDGWVRVGGYGFKITGPNPIHWKPYAPVAQAA